VDHAGKKMVALAQSKMVKPCHSAEFDIWDQYSEGSINTRSSPFAMAHSTISASGKSV